jgi:hypothetical protein
MKTKTTLFTTMLIVTLLAVQNIALSQTNSKKAKSLQSFKSETVALFNGKNLNNWVFKLKDPAVDPSKIFTVQNGVIHIKGDPFGYMRTKEIYADYKLHVEWRWPLEATNSGVFVHAQKPDTIWIKCVECQLQAGNAGDFVCMNGADMNERTDKTKRLVKKMTSSSEKSVGEWNTMEVTCKGNTIEVIVNGVLQNKATNVNVNKGSICLQSEGKDVEFRNVFITKLPKLSGK